MQSLRLLIVVGVTLIVGSDARADQLKLSDGRCLKEVPSLVSKSKPQHTEVSLIECGIDKSKPPLIEYRLDPVTGRCHENQIYKSTKGLGQVVTFLPYKAIPFSECGFDMSQPTIGYSLSPLGSQCLRAKIYMSKTGQGELRIPDGRATLADCGFDMRHPTQTIYEWKVPGMSCRKKLIFTSKIVKSELTRFSSKDVSVVDCTRNSTTPEAPSTARGTRAN